MIDLLILVVFSGVFYGGFKAGNAFKTVGEMLEAGLKAVK